jgi:hypothetical protein
MIFVFALSVSSVGCDQLRGPKGDKGDAGTSIKGSTGATGSAGTQIYRYMRTPDANPYTVTCPELSNNNMTVQVNLIDSANATTHFPFDITNSSGTMTTAYFKQNGTVLTIHEWCGSSQPVPFVATDGTPAKIEILITVYNGADPIDKTPVLYGGYTQTKYEK